jgi:hypothetical protein
MGPPSPANRFGALRSRRVERVAFCAAASLFGLAIVPPAGGAAAPHHT